MIKILAIGNSFSEDAFAYLHRLAASGGIDAETVNLYIGGCPLELHASNAADDAAAYDEQINGQSTGRAVSIREALCAEDWDIVTLQQASHFSGLWDTYQPYLGQLSAYIRRFAPSARQMIHETWAYEADSDHGGFAAYDRDQRRMYELLRSAYHRAAEAIDAPVIPVGDAIEALRRLPGFDYWHGGRSLCRDGYHLELCYGRYAAAAVWYETVLGGDIRQNPFVPDGGEGDSDPALLEQIKQTVHAVCQG